jgi:hypothetical protein
VEPSAPNESPSSLFRELGDEYSALMATRMLAWMLAELGDVPAARALHEANLERARALRSCSKRCCGDAVAPGRPSGLPDVTNDTGGGIDFALRFSP